MILDTSAIIATLRDEPEAMSCAQAISDAMSRRVGYQIKVVTNNDQYSFSSRAVLERLAAH